MKYKMMNKIINLFTIYLLLLIFILMLIVNFIVNIFEWFSSPELYIENKQSDIDHIIDKYFKIDFILKDGNFNVKNAIINCIEVVKKDNSEWVKQNPDKKIKQILIYFNEIVSKFFYNIRKILHIIFKCFTWIVSIVISIKISNII